jgi:CheY-like chemotaxis protein
MTTVLVVEDELNIRKFVSANLKARGFQVMEAPDAETGWETLQTTVPDLMVLDIKLPGMDGWQLLELVITDPRLEEVPVVVMTAHHNRRRGRSASHRQRRIFAGKRGTLVSAVHKAPNGAANTNHTSINTSNRGADQGDPSSLSCRLTPHPTPFTSILCRRYIFLRRVQRPNSTSALAIRRSG